MQNAERSTGALLLVSAVLAALCLPALFILLKIGPGGYRFYGPQVPDIRIYGGWITGKDRSFPGISFAWKFQLGFIILVVLCSLVGAVRAGRYRLCKALVTVNLVLLVLFPLWLWAYTQGVIDNSDNADLTVQPGEGLLLYILLLLVQGRAYLRLRSQTGAVM